MTSTTNITVKSGEILTVKFANSSGGSTLSFDDNTDYAHLATYLGSLDGEQFMPMTQQFMHAWQIANVDLYMRIDATRFGYADELQLTNIAIDVDDFSIETIGNAEHVGNIANSTAFDVSELKQVVEEQCFTMSKSAEDNAAWPVKYYRATLVRNIDVLSNFELKSIQNAENVKTVPVFYPHTPVLGKLDFDQFGLKYDEITNLHILAETFHRIYTDEFARPSKNDIVYIDFLDQYFEVSDVDDVKTPTNAVLYYDIKLSVITDRSNVAKDSDLLDLHELITGSSQADLNEAKVPESLKPVYIEMPEKVWNTQKFKQAQLVQLQPTDNFVYGICYYDGKWQKFMQHGEQIIFTTLSGKTSTSASIYALDKVQFDDYTTVLLTDNTYVAYDANDASIVVLACAKYVMFDLQLNNFDTNMYYTSYTLPRTLQPLLLVELAELVN